MEDREKHWRMTASHCCIARITLLLLYSVAVAGWPVLWDDGGDKQLHSALR